MSLTAELAHTEAIGQLKGQVQTHVRAGWQHEVRRAKAFEETCKIKADTQEVRRDTAGIRHEIALEQKSIAQNDLTYTREMGILKGEKQNLKLQIERVKLGSGGKGAPSTSFNRSAANNIKSRPRVPVEV